MNVLHVYAFVQTDTDRQADLRTPVLVKLRVENKRADRQIVRQSGSQASWCGSQSDSEPVSQVSVYKIISLQV